jgi:hypothetical protein
MAGREYQKYYDRAERIAQMLLDFAEDLDWGEVKNGDEIHDNKHSRYQSW